MKENSLVVRINRPVSEVFDFTVMPSNTPAWIDSIVSEQVEGGVVGLGARYTNEDKGGNINTYEVSRYEINRIFELHSVPPSYGVRYAYMPISDIETELEYFEWMDDGELKSPFEQKNLENLKRVLEERD